MSFMENAWLGRLLLFRMNRRKETYAQIKKNLLFEGNLFYPATSTFRPKWVFRKCPTFSNRAKTLNLTTKIWNWTLQGESLCLSRSQSIACLSGHFEVPWSIRSHRTVSLREQKLREFVDVLRHHRVRTVRTPSSPSRSFTPGDRAERSLELKRETGWWPWRTSRTIFAIELIPKHCAKQATLACDTEEQRTVRDVLFAANTRDLLCLEMAAETDRSHREDEADQQLFHGNVREKGMSFVDTRHSSRPCEQNYCKTIRCFCFCSSLLSSRTTTDSGGGGVRWSIRRARQVRRSCFFHGRTKIGFLDFSSPSGSRVSMRWLGRSLPQNAVSGSVTSLRHSK